MGWIEVVVGPMFSGKSEELIRRLRRAEIAGARSPPGADGGSALRSCPMFSGKSEELIRRLRRAEIARQRVQIFKPAIDARYTANEIVSHSGLGIPSDNVFKAAEIMEKLSPRTEVIGIDEARSEEHTSELQSRGHLVC